MQKHITRSIGFYKQHSKNAHTVTKQKKNKRKNKKTNKTKQKEGNKEKVHYTTKF